MKNRILVLPVLLSSVFISSSFAADMAGKVAFSFGDVSALDENGIERPLKKGDSIYSGDTLVTKEGRLQVGMTDGAFISVQPSSKYLIEDYHFKQESDGKESSIYSLLKGGIRAVTGLIGKRNRDAYKVKTPAATIGIRGTGHNTRVCAGDCFDASGNLLPDGLHHTTWEGQTFVINDQGVFEVPTGNSVFVSGSEEKPKTSNTPPKIVGAVSSQQKKNRRDGVKAKFSTSDQTVNGVRKVVLQQDNTDRRTTFATAFSNDDNQDLDVEVFAARAFGLPPRAAVRTTNGNQESVVFNGQVKEFNDIGDVQIFRWTNGTAAFFRNGVLDSTRTLNSNQGLHVAVIDQSNVFIPNSKEAAYTFTAGDPATKATQADGLAAPSLGLSSGTLTVNFGDATLDANLVVNGPSDVYSLNQMDIAINSNATFASQVGVTSSGCSVTCTGEIAGGFGSNTKALTDLGGTGTFTGPTHIGLSYGIYDDSINTQINGAAILTGN